MATLAPTYGRSGTSITGSWFPTGFHGHSRTGRRNDFINEFRYRAKPTPPVVFTQRIQERPESHIFSVHDNREAYLRPEQSCAKRELSEKGAQTRLFDGEFFDLGLGKRKIANSSQRSDNRLFWWMPHQVDFESPGHPQLSMYRSSYNAQQLPSQIYVQQATVGQAAANTPGALTKERFTTMYRYTYNNSQNNNGVINVLNNAPLTGLTPSPPKSAPNLIGRHRAQACNDTVRSCLVWPQEKRPTPSVNRQTPIVIASPVVTTTGQTKARETPAPPVVSFTPAPNNQTVKQQSPVTVMQAPLPPAGFCDDYGPKPLIFTPLRGNVIESPYTNEAAMAAMAYKQRTSNVLGVPQPPPQYQQKAPQSTTVTTSEPPPPPQPAAARPQTTFQEAPPPPAESSGGLARSKSEADLSRSKSTNSIVFSTRLW